LYNHRKRHNFANNINTGTKSVNKPNMAAQFDPTYLFDRLHKKYPIISQYLQSNFSIPDPIQYRTFTKTSWRLKNVEQ
jgi:hypothetical protein